MRQIYDFEQYEPPVLNEAVLQKMLEKKRMRRQIILLAAAVVLSQAAMVLLGVLTREFAPVSAFCFGYAAVSAAGSVVIAAVYSYRERGGNERWQLV